MKKITKYYDGTNLLNMRDEENKEPIVYISLSGRNYGKTTWFYNYMIDRAINEGKRFLVLTRNKNDINGVAVNIIEGYMFNEYKGTFEVRTLNDGVVKQLTYTEGEETKILGNVLSLSSSNKIKTISKALEVDLDVAFFDEFIVEPGSSYLTSEMTKLQSILTSVFRSRPWKLIMCANLVSSLCPAFGTFVNKNGMSITEILEMNKEAKKLKGIGWVLEIAEQSESVKTQLEENSRAFNASLYTKMSTSNEFQDDRQLIDKSLGKMKRKVLCNLHDENNIYRVSKIVINGDYLGMMYCERIEEKDEKVQQYTLTLSKIATDNLYISGNGLIRNELRQIYDCGYIRFDSLSTKAMMLQFLKYETE